MMLNMKRYWIVGYEKWEIEIRIIESDKKFLFLVHLIAMEIRIGRKKKHTHPIIEILKLNLICFLCPD